VDWVFVTAEKKPFVSAVWLGTFLLMAGFSVSIIRHWKRDRSANRAAAGGAPVVLLLIVGMAALGPVIPASAQVRQTHDPVVGTAAMTQAQPSPSVDPSLTRKAILASLVLPGLGHRIVDPVDWRRGKIHMGAEAVLAASLIRAVHREGSLQNEFETLAKLRAGVTLDGKSRRFELAMADYDDLASYNEAMLRSRYWDRLIEDTPENRWQWASAQDRKDYGELRSDADRAARQIPAMLSMMAVNRVISALSAYTRARRASSAATQSAASTAAFSNTTTSLMLRPVSTSMDGPAGVQLTATIRF
jgi:hypothetical protein